MLNFLKKIPRRRFSQIAILIIIIILSLKHQIYGIENTASIHAYCPFGAVASFFTYITTGEFIKRIYASSFILMGIFLVLSFLFGRVFCSYFCPMGFVQEIMRKIGKKIGIKKVFELPKKLDKYLRYVKYIFMVLIIIQTYRLGELMFMNIDPFNAMMHFGAEFGEKIIAYMILLILLVTSLFTKTLWCRYFCPLGAFFGLIKKISPMKIVRDEKSCISCGLCNINCPAKLDIKDVKAVNSADCISCFNCVSKCPKQSLNFITILGKKVSKKFVDITVIVGFFIALIIVVISPIWETKTPSNIITEHGMIDASNIRGSNSLNFVIKETGIPFIEFQKEFGFPDNTDLKMKIKDIGPTYEIMNKNSEILETEEIRNFIEERLNM